MKQSMEDINCDFSLQPEHLIREHKLISEMTKRVEMQKWDGVKTSFKFLSPLNTYNMYGTEP